MQYSQYGVADKQSLDKEAVFELSGWYGGESSVIQDGLLSLLESLSLLDGRMRVVLRRDGAYLAGCSGAVEALGLGTCLHLQDGIVRASQPEYSNRFQELLKVKAAEVRSLALPCRMIDGHLLVRATSIHNIVVCLNLQRATETVEPELADLEDVFRLTKAEASIVCDLYSGHTPQQIAVSHGNSIHTIRAHIRRCYDKLGITCREELWRKLNAYRLS